MLKIGLTGGIASGKTTVANMFAALGAGIVDTDLIARELVELSEPGLAAIIAEFGPSIALESGALDRAALRRIVFRDAERRSALEAILHPLIRARTLQRLELIDAPYAIVVVPLLLETGFDELVERILVVDCPEQLQLERLSRRDGIGLHDARAMLEAQIDRPTRLAQADDIIDNSGTSASTRAQVEALHARYFQLAAKRRLPK